MSADFSAETALLVNTALRTNARRTAYPTAPARSVAPMVAGANVACAVPAKFVTTPVNVCLHVFRSVMGRTAAPMVAEVNVVSALRVRHA